jgi:hypothetical protein
LLYSWRLLLCSLRLRQKYQALTANKKVEGTVVVYCSKFGSPMSQMGHKRTFRKIWLMSALPSKADIASAFMSTRPVLSEYQTTNLRVRSSNLFGRAKMVINTGISHPSISLPAESNILHGICMAKLPATACARSDRGGRLHRAFGAITRRGEPAIDANTRTAIAQAYAKEKSLRVVGKQFGVGVESVRRCLTKKSPRDLGIRI